MRPPPEFPNRPSFRRSSRAHCPGAERSPGPAGAAEPPSPTPASPGRLFPKPASRTPPSPAPLLLAPPFRSPRRNAGPARSPPRTAPVPRRRGPRTTPPVPSPPGTGERAASGTALREGTIRPLTPVRPRTGHRVEGVLPSGPPRLEPRRPPPSGLRTRPSPPARRRYVPGCGCGAGDRRSEARPRFSIPVRHPGSPSGATPNEGGPVHGSGTPFLRRGGAVLFVPDFVERGDSGDFLRRSSPPIFLRFAPGRGALAAATVVARARRREPEDANFAALRRPREPGVRNGLHADPPAPVRPDRARPGPARSGAPPGREGTANARID